MGRRNCKAYLIMKLIQCIVTVGLFVAALVLAFPLLWYFTGNTVDGGGNREFNGSKTNFSDVMIAVGSILNVGMTIILVSFPEGMVPTVTMSLTYCLKRMMAEHAMVRNISAFWETIGSATIICTDKTGIFTVRIYGKYIIFFLIFHMKTKIK
jgi:Ca2+-transporting ATPase